MDLTLIISTRNRAQLLRQTLEKISAQKLGEIKWEVIVVDNGSSDGTRDVLVEMQKFLPLEIMEEPTPGKNRALNKAIKAAKGRLCVFTDDDIIPDPDWLNRLYKGYMRWPETKIFCGPVEPVFPSQYPSWIDAKRYKKTVEMAFVSFAPQCNEGLIVDLPFGPNLAIASSVFQDHSYDPDIGPAGKNYPMGSESELLKRLRDQGESIVFIPEAKVKHVICEQQFQKEWLCKRAFRFGWGKVEIEGSQFGIKCFVRISYTLFRDIFKEYIYCFQGKKRFLENQIIRTMHLWCYYGVLHGTIKRLCNSQSK